MNQITYPIFKNLIQVGIVVSNLDGAMEKYSYDYGIGPWYVLEFNSRNVKNMQVHDLKRNYSMKIGVCLIGDVRFELIEPLDDSIYTEFHKKYGNGVINHLKLKVDNYTGALRYFKLKGIEVLQLGYQLGIKGKNKYAYLSTDSMLGFITEIADVSYDFIKPDPDYWYPCKKEKIQKSIFVKPIQIGLVVENLKNRIKQYSEFIGIQDWHIEKYDSDNVNDMFAHGKRKNYSMNIAFYRLGNLQIKLIEPISDSIYSEFIDKYGDKVIHHLKMEVENYNDAIVFFKSNGLNILQSGKYLNKIKFSYLNTSEDLGFITEISEINNTFILDYCP